MDPPRETACTFIILTLMVVGVQAEINQDYNALPDVSAATWVAVAGVSVVLLVFVLALCGGCTPMEVGSDQHAASGGKQAYSTSGMYDTDANTRVLESGTTLPAEPYNPRDQAQLPYAMHPQGVSTATTFSGYSPIGASTGYQQVPTTPTAPVIAGYAGNQGGFQGATGYQQAGNMAGYQGTAGYQQAGNMTGSEGSAGYQSAAGYQGAAGYQRQTSNLPGANRHFSESEPPPPAYDEAMRS